MTVEKTSICFVTNELYPLGPGGIGRMLYNFAKHNEEMGFPAELHYLIPAELLAGRPDTLEVLADAFEGLAEIHVCPALTSRPDLMAQLFARAAAHPWTIEWQLASSYGYYQGLVAAERKRGAPFDIIEFPDFGGWAIASVEAKRTGLAFANTQISARIHSTQGLLNGIERFAHEPGHWAGVMFDAERHLLAHADIIVGHDAAIMDYTAAHYRLADRWRGRSRLEFPPIFVEDMNVSGADAVDEQECGSTAADFIFSSRLQPVKRPDIFIRAAILFLERHEDYEGRFRLVCNGWDKNYIAGLRELVPAGLNQKILFIPNASSAERNGLVSSSIVVIPSDYESLCLFAFEAAHMGQKVILNARCPAFGKSKRWQNGETCLLFDGSVEGLASAMEEALSWKPTALVDAAPDRPYWLQGNCREAAAGVRADDMRPGVAVICHGVRSPAEFKRHFDIITQLESELDIVGGLDEICFILPRAHFVAGGAEARCVEERGWKLAFSSGTSECPEMFGRRLTSIEKEVLLLYPFGYEAAPGFIRHGLTAFERDPSLSIASGHIELVDPLTARTDYLRAYSGESPSVALLSSRIVPSFCLIRRDVVSRVPFDARAGKLWFEVFARECALRGEHMVIAPLVAATLDALMAGRRETTKKISAGILDSVGLAAGLPARLISVDPVQPPGDGPDQPTIFAAEQLRSVSRINPLGRVRDWEPVGPHDGTNGVLIHPLANEITIGELPGPLRRVGRLVAHVREIHGDNQGAEVAIALARANMEPGNILSLIRDGGEDEGIALSAWSLVEARGHARLDLPTSGVSKGNDKLLLLSRPVGHGDGANCNIIFEQIDVFFNENLL